MFSSRTRYLTPTFQTGLIDSYIISLDHRQLLHVSTVQMIQLAQIGNKFYKRHKLVQFQLDMMIVLHLLHLLSCAVGTLFTPTISIVHRNLFELADEEV